jgi:hypothetical protein
MKLKIRPDDASMLQMNDWLTELREDDRPEPPAASPAEVARPAYRTVPTETVVPAYRTVPTAAAVPTYRAVPTEAAVFAPPAPPAEAPQPQPQPQAETETETETEAEVQTQGQVQTQVQVQAPRTDPTVRSVIGDQLRMPIMWCEMGSCVSWHADPAALGEADNRARAIDAGWRIDGFGRLACPRCQQADPAFRVSGPVVPWDRYTAMARAARIVAGR